MSKDELKRLRAILELRAKDGRVDRFEALVRADERKKWKGLADAKGVLDFGSELVTPEFGRGALWAEQKLKEKNEGTIR
jgi:hypothetical protein